MKKVLVGVGIAVLIAASIIGMQWKANARQAAEKKATESRVDARLMKEKIEHYEYPLVQKMKRSWMIAEAAWDRERWKDAWVGYQETLNLAGTIELLPKYFESKSNYEEYVATLSQVKEGLSIKLIKTFAADEHAKAIALAEEAAELEQKPSVGTEKYIEALSVMQSATDQLRTPVPVVFTCNVKGAEVFEILADKHYKKGHVGDVIKVSPFKSHVFRIKHSGFNDVEFLLRHTTPTGERKYPITMKVPENGDVRAVRWEKLSGGWVKNFYANGDVTCSDWATMCPQKQIEKLVNYFEALTYCSTLSYAKRNDWKIPSLYEMKKIHGIRRFLSKRLKSTCWTDYEVTFPRTGGWGQTLISMNSDKLYEMHDEHGTRGDPSLGLWYRVWPARDMQEYDKVIREDARESWSK